MIDDLYGKIYEDEMNNLCFDCGKNNPDFISINNGIFLCERCADIHLSFPEGVSIIVENDLDKLSDQELNYLIKGGNSRLNDFILDEYPNIQDFPQKHIYRTVALDYYRKRLRYYILGGSLPVRPSQTMGARLIDDNKNSKTKTYKPSRPVTSHFVKNPKETEDFFKEPIGGMKKNFKDDDFFNKVFGNEFFQNDFMNEDPYFFESVRPENLVKTYKPMKKNLAQSTNPYIHKNNEGFNIRKAGPEDSKKKKHFTNVRVNKGPENIPKPKEEIKQEVKQEPPKTSNVSSNVNQRSGTINPNKYVRTNFVKPTPIKKEDNEKKMEIDDDDQDDEIAKEFARVEREAAEKEMRPKVVKVTPIKPNNNENHSNNPFEKKDSTDLIILPGHEDNFEQKKKKVVNKQIPADFSKQATRLSHLTETINENDEFDPEKNPDSFENENETTVTSEPPIEETFKDSIRNKYKKRKSQMMEEEVKRKKTNSFKKPRDKEEGGFNKKNFVRRLSKMNITETNWNINQIGDINTYPETIVVEDL